MCVCVCMCIHHSLQENKYVKVQMDKMNYIPILKINILFVAFEGYSTKRHFDV